VLRERRIGHLGTLDPFATGLLVLLVGRVTRLAAYMAGEPKTYDATIRFGAETDTDDLTGTVSATAPIPDRAVVHAMLQRLTGTIEQQPPAYSAKQVGGVRAYDAARRGRSIELRAAHVTVHEWLVREWRSASELDVTVTCGGGTYVRALARDLGRLAGSAAHLAALRRTRSGPFELRYAIALDDLDDSVHLRSPIEGLGTYPAITLAPEDRRRVARGQSIPRQVDADHAVLVDADGIVAIAERDGDRWAPRVVLRDA
jgi:tRNA pseudouridine55 synthase